MSAIDVQNAKQIRDPMQVLIEFEVPDNIPMTYSGYSGTAKIYDSTATLDNNYASWPMRKIADLQGDGFALNGTCALYDSSIVPSLSNGRLGVKGHVNQTLDITASSSDSMYGLSLRVTGATSVTYNGTTTAIVGDQAVIDVNNTTITMTFNPATNRRVEVVSLIPGTTIIINNQNLISATVSLRTDLSTYNPTLPESELNIEVYNDADISSVVASIPSDTPITYSAGYAGDMSTVRKFYVSDQVTWKDNVISIHAVDAVHFMDKEMPSAVYCKYIYDMYDIMLYIINECGVGASADPTIISHDLDGYVVVERQSMRDLMASLAWLLHYDNYSVSYIDAGIPTLKTSKQATSFIIKEEDAGDVERKTDRNVTVVNLNMPDYDGDAFLAYSEVGKFDWYKNKGAFVNIDEHTWDFCVAMTNQDMASGSTPGWWSSTGASAIIPSAVSGHTNTYPTYIRDTGLRCLFDSNISQGDAIRSDSTAVYTQVIPWNAAYEQGLYFNITSQNDMWSYLTTIGVFENGLENYSGVLWGHKIKDMPTERIIGSGDTTINVDVNNVWGSLQDVNSIKQFPIGVFETLLTRSHENGSFRWKGDPRMQPGDVVTFKRLDGTDETITLENITIHHDGGGTWSEITYRKGVI